MIYPCAGSPSTLYAQFTSEVADAPLAFVNDLCVDVNVALARLRLPVEDDVLMRPPILPLQINVPFTSK